MIEVKNQYVLVESSSEKDNHGVVVHNNENVTDIPVNCVVHFDKRDAIKTYINRRYLKAINTEKIFAIERKDR